MNLLALDFETYFDDEYSLRKLTTEEYIRDRRFEALLCGFIGQPRGESEKATREWIAGPDLPKYFAGIDWNETAILAHHAHFDGLILSHHYGVKPRFIYDTLSMARLVHGNHVSVSLQSLADHYHLDGKSVPYDAFRGKRWNQLSSDVRAILGAGCLHDIELTVSIFQKMAQGFPREEYQIIDMTVRMFTEPQLVGDIETFGKVWTAEAQRKQAMLAELKVDPKELQSADKFAKLLRAEGIEPEKKPGKSGDIYAFAKTDQFMQDLQEHEDDRVRTLVECRLGLKSTLDQTRAERLGYMATRGAMPVYLSYCGAHTTRWSGGDKVNWQNLKRGSLLRKGVGVPRGYKAIKADKSQIECRILNYVAGQDDVIERFARNEDPYVGIASKFYGRPITKSDPAERGVGKQLELSCGYGAGGPTIVRTAARGTYGPRVVLSEGEGIAARDLYRTTHPGVVDYWKQASRMISAIAGTNHRVQWGPLLVDTGVIYLPNGCPLWYPELHYHRDEETGEEEWRYKTRKGFTKLYGGKLVENCLTADTKVLTVYGWKRIVDVRPVDLVWDGEDWVRHDGCIAQGKKRVIELAGVRMTPDHKVLTEHGWIRAAQTQGFFRGHARIPEGFTRRGVDWSEAVVEGQMCLWERDNVAHGAIQKQDVMRVSELRSLTPAQIAWAIEASRLRSLAVNARQMPPSDTPSVEKLRSARDHSLQALAEIREFLGRHGPKLSAWFNAGTEEQFQRLQQSELPMGYPLSSSPESAREPKHKNTVGKNDRGRSSEARGAQHYDAALSDSEPMAFRPVVPVRDWAPVYDLVNCGPRHQFVVLGDDGPFIVHNCIQALSRVDMSQSLLRILARTGIRPCHLEHDAATWLVPERLVDPFVKVVNDEMTRAPTWLPDIPLGCDVEIKDTL